MWRGFLRQLPPPKFLFRQQVHSPDFVKYKIKTNPHFLKLPRKLLVLFTQQLGWTQVAQTKENKL